MDKPQAAHGRHGRASKAGGRRSIRRGVYMIPVIIGLLILGLYFADVVTGNLGGQDNKVVIGVTFSKTYAESLGLDWKLAYTAILDDLGARHLRLPAYWDEIEPEPGVFNFDNIDWQVEEARKRNAEVILAVGRKLPRWPECRVPAWAQGMDETLLRARILTMVEKVVRHFANQPNIVMWQVENEPFFPFGTCPEPDRNLLKQEVQVVHAIDNRQVMITESGELSTWINAASLADVLGISTYRVVWDKRFGYLYWPITPATYSRRAMPIRSFVNDIIISELQAEPWVPNGMDKMSVSDQVKLMNPSRLQDNVTFAERTGFSAAYLWGVEWWYWLKEKQGRLEMWNAGRAIISQSEQRHVPPASAKAPTGYLDAGL